MPGKKTISAKQLVADIRGGMTDEELIEKYGLTAKSLEIAKTKLLASGHLASDDITRQRGGHEGPVVHETNAPASVDGRDLIKALGAKAGKLLSQATEKLREKAADVLMEDRGAQGHNREYAVTGESPGQTDFPIPGAQKECPMCGELVSIRAKKCRHCGEMLDMTLRVAEEARRAAGISPQQQQTIIMPGNIRPAKGFPHITHCILTLLTGGLWGIAWLIAYLRWRDKYR